MIKFLAAILLSSFTLLQEEGLLFREDWKEIPAELPVTQNHIDNPDLSLLLYGPGKDRIKKSHHDYIEGDPFYLWSGSCRANWAVAFSHRRGAMDLSGESYVRWRTRQSGFRQLRVILKLRSGQWLVSEAFRPATPDWEVGEIHLQQTGWKRLDIDRISEESEVESPDLSQVTEIGFTDLMSGGLSPASSRVDWFEVYGRWSTAE